MPVYKWYAPKKQSELARLNQLLFGQYVRVQHPPARKKKKGEFKQIGGKYYHIYPGALGRREPDENGRVKQIFYPTVQYLARHDGVIRIESEKLAKDARRIFKQLGIDYE